MKKLEIITFSLLITGAVCGLLLMFIGLFFIAKNSKSNAVTCDYYMHDLYNNNYYIGTDMPCGYESEDIIGHSDKRSVIIRKVARNENK